MGLLILLSQLFEKGMLEDLGRRVALIRIIDEHLCNDVLGLWGHMRDQLLYSDELLRLEVELHVSSMPK
jgi:hypothetical protein